MPSKLLLSLLATAIPAGAIEIQLDYSLDTSGFFNQPGSREAMRACADFFEEILKDDLGAIDQAASGRPSNRWAARPRHPATGNTIEIVNLVVPEDTLIIYLGARNLGGNTTGIASTGFSLSGDAAWFDTVLNRGQVRSFDRLDPEDQSVILEPAIDYAPWGGSIAFDTTNSSGNARNWNFSTTTAGGSGQTDFVSVAMHELCHILGIGQADSWDNKIPDRSSASPVFFGEASRNANGGVRPITQPGGGHWAPTSPGPYTSPVFGSFGNVHGVPQQVLMNPSSTSGGSSLESVTDLDIAGLIDIGWEVQLPTSINYTFAPNLSSVSGDVPTNTNFRYQLQEGNLQTPFVNVGPAMNGNGQSLTLIDQSPPEGQNFYRLAVTPLFDNSNGTAPPPNQSSLITVVEDWVSNCDCEATH